MCCVSLFLSTSALCACPSMLSCHDVTDFQTVRFKNELERNITIKLGYANAKIFKAVEGASPGPGNFRQERKIPPFPLFVIFSLVKLLHLQYVRVPTLGSYGDWKAFSGRGGGNFWGRLFCHNCCVFSTRVVIM